MTRKTWKMSYIFTQVVCSNPEMTRKVNNLDIKLYILQHSSQWWFLSRTFVCFFSWLSFYWLSPNEVTFYRLNFLINPNKRNQKYETTVIFCYLTIFMDVNLSPTTKVPRPLWSKRLLPQTMNAETDFWSKSDHF